MGPDTMIFSFWMLSFKPAFSLSSFMCITRLFSPSLLSAIRVVSSVHLRLLNFSKQSLFQLVTHLAQHFVWYILHMSWIERWQYTALSYSFPNLEPVCCSMSSSNCCFLTCLQVSQETIKVVWYAQLLKNSLQFIVIHTVKDFREVNVWK